MCVCPPVEGIRSGIGVARETPSVGGFSERIASALTLEPL